MDHPQDASWFHERESAWLYRIVADQESDPRHRQLFLTLAEAAEHQARIWVERMGHEPPFRPTVRARPIIAAALNPAHAVANDTSGAPPNRANAASGPSVWP